MRINKFLSTCGLGSRRKVEQLILDGKVKVNNVICTNLSTTISPNDLVLVNDLYVSLPQEYSYIILNKPSKVLSSVSDNRGRTTVVDLIKETKSIHPVGRLDYETTGLLILTNDGNITNKIIHPKHNIEKEYKVEFLGRLSESQINQLQSSYNIDGYNTKPAIVKDIVVKGNSTSLSIIVFEGRNRQIRKMFEAVGVEKINLQRVRIGGLRLPGNLRVGEYKFVDKNQINKIFNK